MPLCNTITHIGGKVTGCFAAVFINGLYSLLDELIQMGAAGVAVAKGAFHENLGLAQVGNRPPHTNFQRIIFGRQCTDFLRMKFHKNCLRFLCGCTAYLMSLL